MELRMSYYYTINSIGLNIVFFASTQSAYNYAVKHNIRMKNGKIKISRCRSDIASIVRKDFMERLEEKKRDSN
jgi:hypothetical protein